MKKHVYEVRVDWIGQDGKGTQNYQSYRRDHEISAGGKVAIPGSSDPAFRGDPARYSPEELLVSSLSSCHMLWYLHLCAVNGIVVLEYHDAARGDMAENADGSGQFTRVVLRPEVGVAPGCDYAKALSLHDEAHGCCFIARSVNFPVECEPTVGEA